MGLLSVKLHAKDCEGSASDVMLAQPSRHHESWHMSNMMVTCCCDARHLLGSAVLALVQKYEAGLPALKRTGRANHGTALRAGQRIEWAPGTGWAQDCSVSSGWSSADSCAVLSELKLAKVHHLHSDVMPAVAMSLTERSIRRPQL